jgi:hypothetical protein
MTTTHAPIPVHTIPTHHGEHLDEILAIFLLKTLGEKFFPGIANAKIVYWGNGCNTPDGRPVEAWEAEGYLPVGVGGGTLFDEHATPTRPRREGECAATLVAKYLDVFDELWFQEVLEFVTRDDLKGNASQYDIGAIAKILQLQHPNDPEVVFEWVMIGLGAKIRQRMAFWRETRQEFERLAKIETIPGPFGKDIRIAVLRSNDPQVAKYATSRKGGDTQLVVQQRETGNIQIFTNHRSGIKLDDVARLVREEEQFMNGKIVTTLWTELEAEGTIAGAENWCFGERSQWLLNGSLTATEIPPTKIPLETIIKMIKVAMDPASFPSDRAENCRQGICTSTFQNPCPWYERGLKRCRKIRYGMSQARTQTPTASW